MCNIEVHGKINKIFHVYVLLGLWRNDDTTRKWFYLIFYLANPVCYLYGSFLSDDKDEFAFSISLGVGTLVVALKLAYILWKQAEILEFTFEIGSHFTDVEECRKIEDKVNKLIRFSCIFLLMTTLCGFSAIILYLPTFTSKKMLPFNMWCPMNCKNSAITYWFAYAYSASTTIITVVGISFNVIVWYLMLNCAIKYEILGSQFRKFTTKKGKSEKKFVQELIGLIHSHYSIQQTINRFKSCLAYLFLVQIITSGIGICGSVYALAFGIEEDNLLQSTINVVLLLHSLFDIFMVTYFGNEINLSSGRLSYFFFESDWIELSKSYKKDMIIFIEIVKKPHELVIGKLYPLNLKTFTSILNLVYSMFNVLKNLK